MVDAVSHGGDICAGGREIVPFSVPGGIILAVEVDGLGVPACDVGAGVVAHKLGLNSILPVTGIDGVILSIGIPVDIFIAAGVAEIEAAVFQPG